MPPLRQRLQVAGEHLTDAVPRPSHVLLHHGSVLAAVGTAATALGIVAALAPGWLLEVDEPASELVRSREHQDLFRAVTTLGSQERGMVVLAGVAAALYRWCRPFAAALFVAALAAVVTDVTVKVVVDRARPLGPDVGTALGSFPSGHTLFAVVVWGLLPPAAWIVTGRRLVFWATVAVATVAVLLVAYSRLYLGAHWPSDVVASGLMGATLLLAAEWAVATPMARRHCDGCRLHRPPDRGGLGLGTGRHPGEPLRRRGRS